MIVRQLTTRGLIKSQLDASLRRGWNSHTMARPSSDLAAFREVFLRASKIAIITGAGVSAESGVPTFRGAGGYWRKWQAQELATPEAFSRNPSRVWEFYHYRREVMLTKNPNPAHLAIAECEARLGRQGREVTVITQNIDELHRRAGSKNILEIHGSLFKTRCISCGHEAANYNSPICAALEGKGAPDPDTLDVQIPVQDLPRLALRLWCTLQQCLLLRWLQEVYLWLSLTWKTHQPQLVSGFTSRAPVGPPCPLH
ncbi:NAD-dependent protein deacylase sirtuin-5, mitochondrial-like isoform X3 [Dunckerocampus dactyliophorus]|uniref:NAD-dependent protein deacylase sirtuin-5, mitochondrial-like isoform X3 n=1 Tax=Dunckerocampus dactyliophorus TaxID=161453 RepID=UPI002404FB0E|nr:NAD-dependent protein deacylase sirtuin-5, mitochondrial-like isoform X3 [Dunckerocampus dactyliophorus]